MALSFGCLFLMPRWLYSLVLRASLPFVIGYFFWRSWRHAEYRFHPLESLAIGLAARADRPLWLHAASMGEAQALAGFIDLLRKSHPTRALLLTVTTPTGLLRARELYEAKGITVVPAPWDLPGTVRRFLAAYQPCAAVVIETEIWPNRNQLAYAQKLPLLMVSARVSERSVARYLRFMPGLMRKTLQCFARIGVQTADDEARFLRIGAQPVQLTVTGNFKFDLPLPSGVQQQGQQLRARWGMARPVWVAGSTHPVEEDVLLAAQLELYARATQAQTALPLLVLAPRRPERFELLAQWLQDNGLRYARFSASSGALAADTQVLLVDVMGELLACYAAADLAFVGGSLAPIGGHNLLEPAALGKPVLCGPHTFNAPELAQLLEQGAGLQRVTDAQSLVAALTLAFTAPQAAQAQGQRAAAVVAANRGAAERALALLRAVVPGL
jgi:3-deoxy-D-manno-octulosonic-acid transferase